MTCKPQRTIQFAMDENDSVELSNSGPLAPPLTWKSKHELWYQHDELDAFKDEVRRLTTHGAQLPEDDTTGLDRYGYERAMHRRNANYHILAALKKGLDEDLLHLVCNRCTAWARALAVEQGFLDFCEIYDPLDNMLGEWSGDDDIIYDDKFFEDSNPTLPLSSPKRKFVDEPNSDTTSTSQYFAERLVRQRTLPPTAVSN